MLKSLLSRFVTRPRPTSVPWSCHECCRTSFVTLLGDDDNARKNSIFIDHARKCPECKGEPLDLTAIDYS